MAANAITFDMQLHAAKYNGACHLNALPPHGMPLNAITFDMAHEICRQDGMSLGGIGMIQQHGAASCCMSPKWHSIDTGRHHWHMPCRHVQLLHGSEWAWAV